jgi:lipoate-protein ligase A
VPEPDQPTVQPSAHALSLAGVDLERTDPPALRVEAVGEVVVVVSRSRDAAREVFVERCSADGVAVVRRPSGGGAVVLGPGVIAASVVAGSADRSAFPDAWFRHFGGALVGALADLGVAGVEMQGVSDLCLGDRKIAGSSLRLAGGRVLYQVSLLVDLDLALLDRYLRTPSREPAYRHGRPHREFVTTLRAEGFDVVTERALFAVHDALTGAAGALRARGATV